MSPASDAWRPYYDAAERNAAERARAYSRRNHAAIVTVRWMIALALVVAGAVFFALR